MAISKDDVLKVKGRGFLRNRGTDCFSGRVVPVAGVFTAEQLITLAECARQFGNGKVITTSRQAAEIVGIPFEKIQQAEAFMEQRGMQFGGTGAKVRPVTACKGSTCVYGNIDTLGLAEEIHQRFYVGYRSVVLPHKFKIGVGGCPNSCMKPSLNDVGIEGRKVFSFDGDKCRGCKVCAVAKRCPMKAVDMVNGKAVIDAEKCISCGVCVGLCPFGAVPAEAESVCRIYAGGTWGKTPRMGTALSRTVEVKDALDVIEKIMLWFKENGYKGERLGAAIDRVGVAAFEKAVFDGDLLERKAEILAVPVLEG